MKQNFFILLMLVGTIFACQDDLSNEIVDDADDNIVAYQGKNAVIRTSDLSNVRFKNIPGAVSVDESSPEGEIKVQGSEELDEWVEVKEEGGELRIEGKNEIPSSMDLNFYMHPKDIARIVVEGDHKVRIISTPVLDYLEIITQGSSELVMENLRVKNLESRREGSSRMFLSSELTDFEYESVAFLASDVQIRDDHYIVYIEDEHDYLLYAAEMETRNDSIYAVGYKDDPLRSYFITHTHELRNEGESFLDALELPTLIVSSKNEGSSESKVWAMDELNVRGEGESVMRYLGNPEVDQRMEGSSTLIKLE